MRALQSRVEWRELLRSASVALACCAVLGGAPALGQKQPTTRPPSALFEPSDLVEDFTLLRTSLEEGHSGLYRYVSRAAINRELDAARARLSAPMGELEFYRAVAPVIAAIQDGHTALAFSQATSRAMDTQWSMLPLRVRVLGKKLFVFRDYSTPEGSLAGRQIATINSRRAEDLLASMARLLPGDGAIPTSRARSLGAGWTFNTLLDVLLGPAATFTLTFEEAEASDSDSGNVALEGKTLPALMELAAAQHPDDSLRRPNAELEFRDGGAIAVLTIREFGLFADLERTKPMDAFFTASFEEMRSRETASLILDLRDNGGGSDELGMQLFSFLADAPFDYYDGLYVNGREMEFLAHSDMPGPLPEELVSRGSDGRWRVLEHPNLGRHEPAAAHFGGKVFALMNGGSFSATAEFLSLAHFHHKATFIGEEAGGGYYGNTSGAEATVTLPHTKLRVVVPLIRYELSVKDFASADRGVPADQVVVYTIDELLEGEDKEMELALELEGAR